MSGRCIMMCAGEFHPMQLDIRPDDWIIAVDGGLGYLAQCGITPHFLLGDFDSMSGKFAGTVAKYRSMGEEHFLQLPVVKDDTDTMRAARIGIEKGYREFLIYGGLGGRLDHTFANIQTMVWILGRGGKSRMVDRGTTVTVAGPGEFRIPSAFTGTVSLFALEKELRGVSIRGMKYNVEDVVIGNDYPVGCSNERLPGRDREEAVISIGEGTALIIMTEKLINKHH